MYRLKKRVYGVGLKENMTPFQKAILEALNEDMNTSKANALIDEMVANANEGLDANPKDKNLKKEIINNIDYISKILGIGFQDPYVYFQFGMSEDEKKQIESLIEQRTEAKKEKNFELSDTIRDQLTHMQINIMDTPNGTMWEKI